MHCLCYLFLLSVILILKSFAICIWCTCFVPTCSPIIIIFSLLVCSLSKPFFKAVHHLFYRDPLSVLLPLICFTTNWYTYCYSTQLVLFNPPKWMRKLQWDIVTPCNWTKQQKTACFYKLGILKKSPDYWKKCWKVIITLELWLARNQTFS